MIRVVDTTILEHGAPESSAWPWVRRLWWPVILVAILVVSAHHVDDGDPSIRFKSWVDLAWFSAIVSALTIEARRLVAWIARRGR